MLKDKHMLGALSFYKQKFKWLKTYLTIQPILYLASTLELNDKRLFKADVFLRIAICIHVTVSKGNSCILTRFKSQ